MENANSEQENRKVISVSLSQFRIAAETGDVPNYVTRSVSEIERIEELKALYGCENSAPSVVDSGRGPSWLRR